MAYITLTKENIDSEHICCAFSEKKCSKGYELKKKGFLPPYIGTPGAIRTHNILIRSQYLIYG